VSLSKDKALVKKFGANLRRERVAKGISQEKLAELADLNIRTVQRIEAGEITILITTADRLKSALDSNWNNLL
jgi:transcriptional regulator with XRE-family HTH domain